MWVITVVYEPLRSDSTEVYSASGLFSFFIAKCLCWALCKRCGNLGSALKWICSKASWGVFYWITQTEKHKENTFTMQRHKYTNTGTANSTLSACTEPQPTVPQGHFLLFFPLRPRAEHEFIWSNDQKIKSAKPSESLGHSISLYWIQSQESLRNYRIFWVKEEDKESNTVW